MGLPRSVAALAALTLMGAPAAAKATCTGGRPLSAQELGLLAAINALRADPAGYAANLRQTPGVDPREAEDFLARQPPVPPLSLDAKLARSAKGHAEDIGPRGAVSHTGSDGSGLMARAHAAGHYAMSLAEEISVGQSTGIGAVNVLVIDPGLPRRPHRRDLLDPRMVLAGVGCAPHAAHDTVCVIDLSGPPEEPGAAATAPCHAPRRP